MPMLPSGLELAIDTRHIMEPTTNWFRAPEGQFWLWAPDEDAKEPPFEPGYQFMQKAVTAAVPSTVDEVLPFVRVVIRTKDGKYYWRGETLADFPKFGALSDEDHEAWSTWLRSESCAVFLRRAVEKCRVQAEVNRDAQGFAVMHSDKSDSAEGDDGLVRGSLPMGPGRARPVASQHAVPSEAPTEAFVACWKAAGAHFQRCAKSSGVALNWLHWRLEPPILEHLAFRVGNQLYFIRIEDADDEVQSPGNASGIELIARECQGIPCLLRLKRAGSDWRPAESDWGLRDLRDGKPVDPPALADDGLVVMTDWEVHDCAVEIVRNQLEQEGCQIMSSQGSPHVDPSIWFVRKRGPEWVIVRAVRWPAAEATVPANWPGIARRCAALSPYGHFASVGLVSDAQPFKADSEPVVPLYRGRGMVVRFTGLAPLPKLDT